MISPSRNAQNSYFNGSLNVGGGVPPVQGDPRNLVRRCTPAWQRATVLDFLKPILQCHLAERLPVKMGCLRQLTLAPGRTSF